MAFRTRALPTIGVEVLDLDLAQGIDDETAAALRQTWQDAGVVLFRGIGTSPEALLALSAVFGEPEPHPIESLRLPGHPNLILLTNKGGLRGPVYAFDGVPTYGRIPWHTDLAFSAVPNAGALLNMVEKASVGGSTAWLDTALAYEALPAAIKRRLDGLEARFEFCADLGRMRFEKPGGVRVGESQSSFPDYPAIAKPIVYRHPGTGRSVLNLCPLNLQGIVGMDGAEGDELLEESIDAVVRPEFIFDHDWAEQDIVLWDNYRMMHRAVGHPADVLRVAHRTTLRGTVRIGRILDAQDAAAA